MMAVRVLNFGSLKDRNEREGYGFYRQLTCKRRVAVI
jgi:hypothetical protein